MAKIEYDPLADTYAGHDKDEDVQEKSLRKLIDARNICELLDEDELRSIAQLVIDEFAIDSEDPCRQEKIARWEAGEQLAKQQSASQDESWWANTHYPLLVDACIKFNAHAAPIVLSGGKIVKKKLNGREKQLQSKGLSDSPDAHNPSDGQFFPQNIPQLQAQLQPGTAQLQPAPLGGMGNQYARDKNQVAEDACYFQNWQITTKMTEWVKDTDRLLLRLAGYGVMYRKLWFSNIENRPKSKILTPLKFVVPPGDMSLEEKPRTSELFELTPNEIKGYVRSGLFQEFDYMMGGEDTEEPQDFIEQHRWLDLDGDGYKEPYIVTVHKESVNTCRILANYRIEDVTLAEDGKVAHIKKRQWYVEYEFIPPIEEKSLPIGFYDLLGPTNEAINKSVNRLIDAGTLQNSNSGFISKDLRIGKSEFQMKVGYFNRVNVKGEDIKKGLYQMQYPGPSVVLFQLMQFLLAGAKELANTQNILENAQKSNMPATTTIALVEQGQKVSNSVYKRIYRAFTEEFKLLKMLNAEYLDEEEYSRIMDCPVSVSDFKDESFDFEPIGDPEEVSDLQRMAKAEFMLGMLANPVLDPKEITRRALLAANIQNVDDLFAKPMPPQPPPPDPRTQVEILKLELEKMKLQQKAAMDAQQYKLDQAESQSKVVRDRAAAIRDLASAEAAEAGQQLGQYDQQLRAIEMARDEKMRTMEFIQRQQQMAQQAAAQQQTQQPQEPQPQPVEAMPPEPTPYG